MRGALLLSLLLMSSTALADQAYIQANAWAVNLLPVMPGQEKHARCMMQTSFSGTASLQFITENQKLRGVIAILTEPVFKEEGRDLSVVLTVDQKPFEFPARTLSKYAIAIDISEAYESEFRQRLMSAELIALKSGFSNYTFSTKELAPSLEKAVACAPPSPPPPPPQVAEAPPSPLTPMPSEAVAQPQTKVIVGGAKSGFSTEKAYIVKHAGKDTPIANAAPLILPPGYKLAFADGASPAERISWSSGSDWLETLVVALDEVGLQAAASGTTVTVLPKLKPVTMPVVADSGRASVIIKEPDSLLRKPTDPSKPPSPGMKDEASALLADMRLDEETLRAIAEGELGEDAPPPKMQPIMSDEDVKDAPKDESKEAEEDVAMPPLPEAPLTTNISAAIEPDTNAVFTAKKGETVKEVLARWSEESGTPIDFSLKRDYFLSQDVRVQGDIELAVEKLFVQFTDLPEKPRLSDDAAAPAETQTATAKTEEAPKKPAEPAVPEALETRLGLVSGWSAVKGTSLRGALSNWTRDAQMQLIWQAPEDLMVRDSVSGTKRFEDALNALLAQYDDAPQKPSVQLNRDPHTGLIAMIVDVQSFTVEGNRESKTPEKSGKTPAKP